MDYDYIEINDGWFFKLSSKSFVHCPFDASDLGKISPRCYKDFDLGTDCDGGHFASSIHNSFPELEKKINFLNKFYQCLLCFQFPHKVPRLVTVGKNYHIFFIVSLHFNVLWNIGATDQCQGGSELRGKSLKINFTRF